VNSQSLVWTPSWVRRAAQRSCHGKWLEPQRRRSSTRLACWTTCTNATKPTKPKCYATCKRRPSKTTTCLRSYWKSVNTAPWVRLQMPCLRSAASIGAIC